MRSEIDDSIERIIVMKSTDFIEQCTEYTRYIGRL